MPIKTFPAMFRFSFDLSIIVLILLMLYNAAVTPEQIEAFLFGGLWIIIGGMLAALDKRLNR